ncbi:MAG: 2-oxo acid dehydrogenase subunit E2 [Lentisphaerae bacterium]|nr:2-oxo acid dehydrogenase subunit E2 [Lentisphaerota bacterium]
MSIEYKLPELGENIETIQVTRVLVGPGDTVRAEEPLLEVETDKATIEVPADAAGTVETVLVKDGDEIKVGQVLLTFSGDAAEAPEADPTPAAKDTPEPAADPTPAAAPAAPPEPPPAAPVAAPAVTPTPTRSAAPAATGPTPYNVPASPSVRRFARERGIDVTNVTGSDESGRVSIEDVKAHAKRINESPSTLSAVGIAAPPLPNFEKWGTVKRKKLAVIRRKTAEHMSMSWNQIPHVSIFDRADITELEVLRKRYSEHAEAADTKLTMAVMVVKVAAGAMKRFPQCNSSIDMISHEIVSKEYVNIGVAVSTDRGLVVPVIYNADQKNMMQIAVELTQLAKKAREGKIQLSELEGGTFTVSNLGRVCGTHFTPIINYPEVAILGMGRSMAEPVVRNGQIEIRTMLPLSLTFDHRVIDGAEASNLLGWIVDAIQEPLLLSLQG